MASSAKKRLLTARDHEILAALDLAPLTARQLLRLSTIWPEPYKHQRTLRERLQQLRETGLVKSFRYATLYPGQPENYYGLSRAGFQALHGPDEQPPTKGHFSEVAISRHVHTRGLADFLVHTMVAAYHSQVEVTGLYRENSIRLTAGEESVYPDLAFVLVPPDGLPLKFFVEIDCGTERLTSLVSNRTWERKARVYDRIQDQLPGTRFRVLVVTVRASSERLKHVLATAASVQRNPDRTLFYGATIYGYRGTEVAVTAPVFIDHRGRRQSLVPTRPYSPPLRPARLLARARA